MPLASVLPELGDDLFLCCGEFRVGCFFPPLFYAGFCPLRSLCNQDATSDDRCDDSDGLAVYGIFVTVLSIAVAIIGIFVTSVLQLCLALFPLPELFGATS